MRLAPLLVLGACAHAPAVVTSPVAARPAVRPIWPVRVRVMTWTAGGPVQLGELPNAPPAEPPTTPWYVEPVRPLDAATFVALVEAVRSQQVPGLSLRGQPITDWGLAALHDLPRLSALVLDDTAASGVELASLGVALHRLYLSRTNVDDAAVAAVVAAHPHLEVLTLEDCAVGDVAAAAIGALAELQAVNLARTAIDDAGGAALGSLARLEIADLGHTHVGAKTIEALRRLPLRELFLDATSAGAEVVTLAPLAATLTRIDLSGLAHRLTDAEVGWIASAPNLVEVGLDGAQVHDALVLALLQLPELRQLRLAEAPISVTTARAIGKTTALVEVDLADTVADDVTTAALLALPRLKILRLDHTPITDRGLSGPTYAPLAELYLSHTAITDAGTRLLADLPHLEALGLGETKVSDATLERVARLTDLHTLVLSKVVARPESFAKLGTLHRLRRLYLDETQAGDDTLTALARAHDLRVLHLGGSQISDASIPTLAGFAWLEELTIGDTRLHAAVAAVEAWPRLRTLSMVGLDVGDSALPSIARRAALTALDLSATDVVDPSALSIAPRLRILGLSQTNLSAPGLAAVRSLTARGVEVVR